MGMRECICECAVNMLVGVNAWIQKERPVRVCGQLDISKGVGDSNSSNIPKLSLRFFFKL